MIAEIKATSLEDAFALAVALSLLNLPGISRKSLLLIDLNSGWTSGY
jgi:hypothetical protein